MSHSDYLASFAMGKADSAMLEISWRDGKTTSMNVKSNRLYEITEPAGISQPARQGQGLLEARARHREVAPVAGDDPQLIERERRAPLVAGLAV